MSARQTQRRGTTPALHSPQPKRALNVEEWEAKAPLTDREITSVGILKTASEIAPLPYKFNEEDPGSSSRPSTPMGRTRLEVGGRLGPGSRPSSPMPPLSASRMAPAAQAHALHPKQPVQTAQQFYDWFALIDRSVAHSQEAHFRAHVASVAAHLATCDALVARIDEVDGEVDGMLEGWRGVEEGGKSLKDACERLLDERDRLLELTDEIGTRLEYFQELEHATRMLNHPGESLVLQTDFLYMVERVDICIDYLKAHRQFREAEIYLLRFQQCMTRAMTLIRMYFVGSLKALSADVSKRISEKDVSPTAQMHLLYTRFKSVSAQLAPLLGELERRAQAHPAELSALLTECHTAYFSVRKALLVGRLTEEIKGLDPTRTELVELTRAGCSYLKQLCTDEFELYQAFFSSGEEQLYQYLENLCDYLYDDLRPRILHEPRLTALCEVCTVLQALMVLDVAVLPADDDGDDDELSVDLDRAPRATAKKGLGQLHISHLLEMVLQDAQTRLFFKAQAVIQADIRYYAPKQEDLAYPDKLLGRGPVGGAGAGTGAGTEKEGFSELFRLPTLDKQETWFPTLRKTVWVLGQLHDFVNPAIFEDIAQEAVTLCRQSLILAADMLKQRGAGAAGALDGELFLVRHLLILKEITNSLDLAQREGDEDFQYGVTDTLASMLNRTTALLPGALFASLGMPRSEEGIRDAKHGIDHDLKRVCEAVIAACAAPICAPLRAWIAQIDAHNARRARAGAGADAEPLTAQAAFQQPAAEALERAFRAACARELRAQAGRLRLYLADGDGRGRTAEVLLQHVRERIGEEYGAWRDVVWNMYAGGMRGGVLSAAEVRELLGRVCGDGEGGEEGEGVASGP
ncbi:Sec34-like family-domain-containing protein [Mycena maculata]|uniref:Conserved oligomeric Golgi complex subunit 3 n=1 Tax=Mycena maculata TaxID=230809 RepID=A0AAD7I0P6_9AGAR|nr:Sec34-like family-domain-containing protein [Mycena maculata]